MSRATHQSTIAQWIPAGGVGTEIGAGNSPVPGLEPQPIHIDCFKQFGAAANNADYYGHACALPFHDHSLDYVIASHVLEHVANPVAALAEWYRVVRPGGIIYFVVPDRAATFDHPRGLTTVDHLFDDFVACTTACDATHIDEFAFGIDWQRYEPETPLEEIAGRRELLARGMHAAVQRGEDINIHFHTFEASSVRELMQRLARWSGGSREVPTAMPAPPSSETRPPPSQRDSPVAPVRFNWELLELTERFPADCPNGILAVLRVHKGWRARADAEAFRLRTQGDWRAVLRDDARPFAEWQASTPGLGGAR